MQTMGNKISSFLIIQLILLQVINFTTRRPKGNLGERYVWSRFKNVKIIHVWHDLAWKTATIIEQTTPGKFSTFNINLEK